MEQASGLIPGEQNSMQGGCDAAERMAGGPTLAASFLGCLCRTQIPSIMLYCFCFPELLFSVLPTFFWGSKSPVCISTLGSFLSHFSSSLISAGRDKNYSWLSSCFLLCFYKRDLTSTEECKFYWDFLKKQTFSTWRSWIEAVACLRFFCNNNSIAFLFLLSVFSKGIWHTTQLQKGGGVLLARAWSQAQYFWWSCEPAFIFINRVWSRGGAGYESEQLVCLQ